MSSIHTNVGRNIYPVRKKGFLYELIRNKTLYIMLLPGIIITLVYRYLPMLWVAISFQEYSPGKGILGSEWVGVEHFKKLFASEDFWRILLNTIIIGFSKQFVDFTAALLLALLLNEVRRTFFKRTIQTVTFFPSLMSWTVIGGMFTIMLSASSDSGMVNALRSAVFPGVEPISFLTDERYFRWIIVITEGWRYMGWVAVIFVAALTGINPEYYEAAVVDGANRWKQTLYITLPSIRSTMILVAILSLQYVINVGPDQLLVFISPNVYSVGDILDTYVYRSGIQQQYYSYATAVGLFKSVIAFVIVWFANSIAKKYEETQLW